MGHSGVRGNDCPKMATGGTTRKAAPHPLTGHVSTAIVASEEVKEGRFWRTSLLDSAERVSVVQGDGLG